MKPKQIWANLAVSDLDRTTKFYTELGFTPNGSWKSDELTSFLFGDSNFTIHFFTEDRFKNDVNGKIADTTNGNEIIFSLSADSRDEVDQWVEKIKNAGGTIYSGPMNFDKGYTFGFSDPDGHKFNFLYWPE